MLSFALIVVVERFRTWLGTYANLRRDLNHLNAFLLLTLFPCAPAFLYWTLKQTPIYSAEQILDIVYGVFTLWQLGFGVIVWREMIHRQASNLAINYKMAAVESPKSSLMTS